MEHQHVHKRETFGIEQHGIINPGNVYRNLSTPALYEEVVRRREGFISHLGPIVVRTGQHTGRAAEDKFVVKELSSQDNIWWGKVNIPFDEHKFELLHQRMCAYLQGRDIYIQDCYAGADANYRIPVRVITEKVPPPIPIMADSIPIVVGITFISGFSGIPSVKPARSGTNINFSATNRANVANIAASTRLWN